ncbi:hypothetical protein CXB51_026387 [Gossypium anomalum]|uniref:Reverse transcriptase Ty1/copia-type domain-containing protein n=1 Tax=Gossypium anomalum TaxID=47600 RepID=A0A8J5Z560_9ROSI|nr:hypothetical protein CXB51_026387 [Gossypium anomalum]
MDVKTTFLNGNLEEEVYMKQPKGFSSKDGEHLFGFVENVMDQCIYQKASEVKICFLILYVDDILLATDDKGMLHEGDKFNLNQCSKNEFEMEQMKNIPYASIVGSLMYTQVYSRLDIVFVVGMFGRYESNLGYIFMFTGGAISWRSVKQSLTATSTMEAEFASCFEVTLLGVWLKSFISRLRLKDSISRPLVIYCDNSVAIFMAKNNKSRSQSKHIDFKYLAIRERVKEKKVVIEHINTKHMLVDPLTKGMPPYKFKDHVVILGLVPTL